MDGYRGRLSRGLGRTDVIAIGFGTMVGWGWIMMAPSWISSAGVLGACLAFVIGGAAIILIGLLYGELTAALPMAGGEFVFAYRSMGRVMGFLTGWIMALAYLSVAAWEGIALATALNYLLPIPEVWPLWEIAGYQIYLSWALVGMGGAFVVTMLNVLGVRMAALFQVMATAGIIVIVVIIFLGGLVYGEAENTGELFTDRGGFSYVLFMIPAMLIGFDVIPQSAEELNLEKVDIGRMIVVCIIISLCWYLLLIIGIGLAAPPEVRDSGIIPVADIMGYAFRSDLFSNLMILGGILGILTTWNGFFMGATRLLFAMGRARVIPEVFSRSFGRNQVPLTAILVVGCLCIITPLMGQNALIWLINMSSLCALFGYIMVAASFVLLRHKEPELERPFRLWRHSWPGMLICIISAAYMILYIVSDLSSVEMRPVFALIIAWLMAGIFLYGSADAQRRRMDQDMLAYTIFGRAMPVKREDKKRGEESA